MSFEEGKTIANLENMREQNINPREVSRLLSRTFNKQIFEFGVMHADPHHGNMFVRKREGRLQLVLLDHGLMKEFDESFRYNYAMLWRGIIRQDSRMLELAAKNLQIEDYKLFSAMLTSRTYADLMRTDKKYSKGRFGELSFEVKRNEGGERECSETCGHIS